METVLVTGAGGYIGSNAAEYFAKAGYRVVGTIHRHIAERLTRLGITTIKIDLAGAVGATASMTSRAWAKVKASSCRSCAMERTCAAARRRVDFHRPC